MRDFQVQLGERLAAMADDIAAEPAPARAAPARRRFRRPAIAGGLTATVAAVGGLFAVTGSSVANLPIFDTPTTDARGIVRALPQIAGSGVDFGRAHAFAAPGGIGYVLTTPAKRLVCVVLPDAGAPGEYGSSCSPSLAAVEQDGFGAEITGEDRSTFAFILPDSAKDVRIAAAGKTTAPVVRAGMVSSTITGPATITWTADGRRGQKRFEGPFAANATLILTCPDGRTIEAPSPTTSGAKLGTNLDAYRRQQCR